MAGKRLDRMVVDEPVIAGVRRKGITWTEPEVVVDVEYRGWTRNDQNLTHPAFKSVRDDSMLMMSCR